MEVKNYIISDEGVKLQNVLHKELDLIQAVITRMAQNSFYMKGWCITLVAAIFSLADGAVREHVYLPLAVMVVVFWGLDSYYLRQERAYRKLYGHVLKCRIERESWQNLYSLDAREVLKCTPCLPRIMFSISEWPLYLILCSVLVLLGRGDVCRVGENAVRMGRCVLGCSSDRTGTSLKESMENHNQKTSVLTPSRKYLENAEKTCKHPELRKTKDPKGEK